MHGNTEHTVRYSRVVPSETEELRLVREVVETEALRFGFDSDTAYRLALAVDEACTNIIKHAYGGMRGNVFQLDISTEGNKFVVMLTDSGQEFRMGATQKLDMRQYFSQMRRGGLGLHIIRLVMDDITYDITSDHINRLQLIKYLNNRRVV